MISPRDVFAGLFGAWRLARLDPQGMSCFDATETGFWQSFFAAVLCAPAYALVVALDFGQEPVLASDARFVAVHAIAYVISWTAFPLAMARAARLLDRERFYLRYIVAQNWAHVLEMMLFLPALSLAATGASWFAILPALAAFVILGYQWYVARTALMIDGLRAAAVIGLALLLDVVVTTALRTMLPTAAG